MANPKIFDLTGKVAMVTGGNGGIGRGIALGLAEAGASVAILARNEEAQSRDARGTREDWHPCHGPQARRPQRNSLKPALEAVERKLGPIDILVNNAGFAVLKGVLDHTEEDWDSVMETNLTSCFLLSKYAAPSMIARKAGKIINVASIGGYMGTPASSRHTESARAACCSSRDASRSNWRRTISRSIRSRPAGPRPT